MNTQEFIAHWRNEMDCECMATGVDHTFKQAKLAVDAARKRKEITVAEKQTVIEQLNDHRLRCKSALKRAA